MTKTRRMEKKKKRLESKLILVFVIALLVVTAFGTVGLKKKHLDYVRREEELLSQIAAEEERAEEIEELGKYMDTNAYVEEIAKERLGLVYEDEILFKTEN